MAELDVIALGELLIDFVPDEKGVGLAEAERFLKAPGGAPANVVVGLSRLGARCGFMGKVGDDAFGHFLASVLQREGVDTEALKFDTSARTALAFVSLTASGERDFMFYRHPSADMRHHPDEIDGGYVSRAKLFHFGSISLIHEPAKSATLKAVRLARQHGARVSFDPNVRLPLWPSAEAAKLEIMAAWEYAHVIKISDAELELLTGSDEVRAARGLMVDGLELLLVTRGEKGSSYLTPEAEGEVAGFAVEAVDTTGAGDAFMAGLLHALSQDPALLRDRQALEAAIRRANACGALATTKPGAIPALPTRAELEAFLRRHEP
jgi:fructokinase